jgi:hypothetical protein
MSLFEKVVDYLTSNPLVKVKLLASDLDENRREINSLLYSKSNTFYKNSVNQWGLIEKEKSDFTSKFLADYPAQKNAGVSIVVENMDLVERIKGELKNHLIKKSKHYHLH